MIWVVVRLARVHGIRKFLETHTRAPPYDEYSKTEKGRPPGTFSVHALCLCVLVVALPF